MKLTIFCILAMLLASAMSYHSISHNKGKDILDLLEEGTSDVYVLFFYAPGHQGGYHNAKTVEDERELVARVLNKYPSFYFAKVNANDPNYQDLVKACGIITGELHESPSVLIIEGGVGVWVHGPQTINKVEEFAHEYLKRSRTSS